MYKELRKGNWAQKFAPALGAGQGLFKLNTTQADEGNRTPNLLITNQLLCQLSYVSLTRSKRQTSRSNIKCVLSLLQPLILVFTRNGTRVGVKAQNWRDECQVLWGWSERLIWDA